MIDSTTNAIVKVVANIT